MNKPVRPSDLHEVPLNEALRPGTITVSMSIGQWDDLLKVAYADGCTLLELDDDEEPVRAYRKLE